jgi:hypothetical protein
MKSNSQETAWHLTLKLIVFCLKMLNNSPIKCSDKYFTNLKLFRISNIKQTLFFVSLILYLLNDFLPEICFE